MNDFCLVISGCPGSGKTSVGREIAKELAIPLLDKDDYLEALFEQRGLGDAGFRTALSQESNALFERDALALNQVVLVSHWRLRNSFGPSGTPTKWLKNSFANIIEIYCSCPVETAAQRFIERRRHEGHLDASRSNVDIAVWIAAYADGLPLDIGKLIVLDTAEAVDIRALIYSIHNRLHSDARDGK